MALKEAMTPSGPSAVRGLRRRSVVGGLALAWGHAAWGSTRTRVLRALVESWPPYLEPGADGSVRGLDAELLAAICRQAGFELSWIRGSPQWRKRRFRELLFVAQASLNQGVYGAKAFFFANLYLLLGAIISICCWVPSCPSASGVALT